jgi:hypothetical protein
MNPVKWDISLKHLDAEKYELVLNANIEKGWYVYSMFLPSDEGPVATSIMLDSHYQSFGTATEKSSKSDNRIEGYDEIFDMQLIKYKNDLTITQSIRCPDPSKELKGTLTFMTSDNERCLPPVDIEFSFYPNKIAKSENGQIEKKNDSPIETDYMEKALNASVVNKKIKESLVIALKSECKPGLYKNKSNSKHIKSDYNNCICPPGIELCFNDYNKGMAYARSVNKPILLDFTGFGCENSRKMEDKVWVNEDIKKYLNNDFVLISLYVDDRTKLDSVEITADGIKIRNLGHKWAVFQKNNFETQYQPYYVLLSPEETVLNSPIGYTPYIPVYKDFLQCGLDNFEKLKKNASGKN